MASSDGCKCGLKDCICKQPPDRGPVVVIWCNHCEIKALNCNCDFPDHRPLIDRRKWEKQEALYRRRYEGTRIREERTAKRCEQLTDELTALRGELDKVNGAYKQAIGEAFDYREKLDALQATHDKLVGESKLMEKWIADERDANTNLCDHNMKINGQLDKLRAGVSEVISDITIAVKNTKVPNKDRKSVIQWMETVSSLLTSHLGEGGRMDVDNEISQWNELMAIFNDPWMAPELREAAAHRYTKRIVDKLHALLRDGGGS